MARARVVYVQDLQAELAGRMGEAEWDWLMPHAERDALVLVASDLDLVDVAVAIANDESGTVQQWIEQSLIKKPSRTQITDWSKSPSKRFNALILQPYVLIQDVAS